MPVGWTIPGAEYERTARWPPCGSRVLRSYATTCEGEGEGEGKGEGEGEDEGEGEREGEGEL